MDVCFLQSNEIAKPTIHDTALVRMPIWIYGLTVGRVLGKKQNIDDAEDTEEDELVVADSDTSSGAGGKHTPSTGSVDDDFELLDKSVEDVSATAAKTTGSQPQGAKGSKRKSKGKRK